MKVIIIDDGVNENYYDVGELYENLEITQELNIQPRQHYDSTVNSHGTTCAAIIKKYAPQAEIGSIKILNDNTKRGLRQQMLKALDWCYENNIKLIHMSIGTTCYSDFSEIQRAVSRLTKNGVLIVAAKSNKGIYTVPACLSSVFGVSARAVYQNDQFSIMSGNLMDSMFFASSRHELMDKKCDQHMTSICNSYATPLITANIINFLENNECGFRSIRNGLALIHQTAQTEILDTFQTAFDFIDKAYVINLSNEKLGSSFCFEVLGTYDKFNLSEFKPIEERFNLVIVANDETIPCVHEVVSSFKARIKGLALCGCENKDFSRIMDPYSDCLIWDESFYRQYLKKQVIKAQKEIDAPVISISGNKKHTYDLLRQLCEIFKDDYFVKTFSDDGLSYLYGFDYMGGQSPEAYISTVYQKTNFDMGFVICELSDEHYEWIDIMIRISDEINSIVFDENKIVTNPNFINQNGLKRVADYIVDFFSKVDV